MPVKVKSRQLKRIRRLCEKTRTTSREHAGKRRGLFENTHVFEKVGSRSRSRTPRRRAQPRRQSGGWREKYEEMKAKKAKYKRDAEKYEEMLKAERDEYKRKDEAWKVKTNAERDEYKRKDEAWKVKTAEIDEAWKVKTAEIDEAWKVKTAEIMSEVQKHSLPVVPKAFDEPPNPRKVKLLLSRRKEAWNLSKDEIDKAIAAIARDGVSHKELEKDVYLLFLYAKRLFADEGLGTYQAYMFISSRPQARQRLEHIVIKSETEVVMHQSWLDFVSQVAVAWGSEDTSYVSYRDHPQLKDKFWAFVTRTQLSGLCYMFAPAVMQHVLVSMGAGGSPGTLDTGMFLRKFTLARDLAGHILLDCGGSSSLFLNSILAERSEISAVPLSYDAVLHSLMQFGPLLVNQFEVFDQFRLPGGGWQYKHGPTLFERSHGYHAMLLIGCRKTSSGKPTYLLQNWWRDKWFVEVSGRYLKTCLANAPGSLIQVSTPQIEIPCRYPRTNFQAAEGYGFADGHPRERNWLPGAP